MWMLVNGLLREQFGFYALCVLVWWAALRVVPYSALFLNHSFNFLFGSCLGVWIRDLKCNHSIVIKTLVLSHFDWMLHRLGNDYALVFSYLVL